MENSETGNVSNTPPVTPKPRIILPIVITAIISLSLGLFLGYLVGAGKINFKEPVSRYQSQGGYPDNVGYPSITTPTPTYPIQITPTPVPPKTITKIPGWLTYTNTIHKYTVQYPPDWTIDSSRANNYEDYKEECCLISSLVISKGDTKWELMMDVMVTGFEAPDVCMPKIDSCSFTSEPITVMGYSLVKNSSILNSSKKIVEVRISTPGDYGHPGFGQVGDNDLFDPYYIKYYVDYYGSEIDKYMETLDRISESLQAIE